MAKILKFVPSSKRTHKRLAEEQSFRDILKKYTERELIYHLKRRIFDDNYDGITRATATLLVQRIFDRDELDVVKFLFCSFSVDESLPLLRKLFELHAVDSLNFNELLEKLSQKGYASIFLLQSEELLIEAYQHDYLTLQNFLSLILDRRIQNQFKYSNNQLIYNLFQIMMYLLTSNWLSIQDFTEILKNTNSYGSFLSSPVVYDYFFERDDVDRSQMYWRECFSEEDLQKIFLEIGSNFDLLMHLASNLNYTLIRHVVASSAVNYQKLYRQNRSADRLEDLLWIIDKCRFNDSLYESVVDECLSQILSSENFNLLTKSVMQCVQTNVRFYKFLLKSKKYNKFFNAAT